MQFFDLILPRLAENIALDEALLLRAEEGDGGEVLRLWTWPNFAVVLGAGGVVADDVNVAACEADGVPIARRSSISRNETAACFAIGAQNASKSSGWRARFWYQCVERTVKSTFWPCRNR